MQPLLGRAAIRPASAILACACAVALAAPVLAQSASGPDAGDAGIGGPSSGGHGGRHGGGRRQRSAPAAAPAQYVPQLKRDPAQRLDPGALLCRSEAALLQHQAAILARLDGGEAEEPAGCRLVRAMTAVAIVERHGPAVTEVRLPGPPEQVGWTDAAVRDGGSGAR